VNATGKDIFHPNFRDQPYWWDAAPPEEAKEDLPDRVDIAIVGSGFCGLNAAAELAGQGRSVVVLEAGPLGNGASTRSGGMVSSGQKMVVGGAMKKVGPEKFARLIEDSIESFTYLQSLIQREKLDADLQLFGRFFGAHAPAYYDKMLHMGRILHEKTGVTVHEISRDRQREVVGSDYFFGGIVVDEYGGLHPAKYNKALRDRARSKGALLRSHAAVTSTRREDGGFLVATARGNVRAGEVIVATNGYTTKQPQPELAKRVVPVRSYQIATEPLDPALMRELNPGRRMITDTKRELFYARPSPDGTRMLFGTRPGAFDRADRDAAPVLYRAMVEIWPQLKGHRITHAWSGFVGMTRDKTARMGQRDDGVHYAVGCNGNGVALMSYLGHRVARKILGQENRPCAFEQEDFPAIPGYNGTPWFLPAVSGWYFLQDRLERAMVPK
jgi:glycine/D-amino acid oxidase-like deaminating enzyme